jgi:hypothetical protein
MLLSNSEKLAMAEQIKASDIYPQSEDEISDPEYCAEDEADEADEAIDPNISGLLG